MIELNVTTIPNDSVTRNANDEKFKFTHALRRRYKEVILKLPNGLVVSSDEEVRRTLGQILVQCGLAPVFASTVTESGITLADHEVLLLLSDDCLSDGKYVDIVKLAGKSDPKVPVIVVSRTGEWPEYLRAIRAGAFDYLAYPPISGELQRVIQNAFRERRRQHRLEETTVL
jgi:two-component system NtrC family response regulator